MDGTFSVTLPLRGSALSDSADYLSEMCPLKLTDKHSHPEKISVLYH